MLRALVIAFALKGHLTRQVSEIRIDAKGTSQTVPTVPRSVRFADDEQLTSPGAGAYGGHRWDLPRMECCAVAVATDEASAGDPENVQETLCWAEPGTCAGQGAQPADNTDCGQFAIQGGTVPTCSELTRAGTEDSDVLDVDGATEVCCSVGDQLCRAEQCDAVLPGIKCADWVDAGNELLDCADLEEGAAGDRRPEIPEIGDHWGQPCDSANACPAGLICTSGDGGTCKFAAMEKCDSSKGSWGESSCGSYGAGHKFQCREHKTLKDKRCCIQSGGKNWADPRDYLDNRKVLKLREYVAVHGNQSDLQRLPERALDHKNLQEWKPWTSTRGLFRHRRTTNHPGGKHYDFLHHSCCAGAVEYAYQKNVDYTLAENRYWYCKSR